MKPKLFKRRGFWYAVELEFGFGYSRFTGCQTLEQAVSFALRAARISEGVRR